MSKPIADPFVKVYATLLESTLWWGEDTATRIVWVTLLVACDHNGVYQGTLPGLAGKARVSLEEARHAVWRLQQPDTESRTKTADGRRLEVIDGVGYRLINYEKYRDKRSPGAIQAAAYKAAQRRVDKLDMSTKSREASLLSNLGSEDPDPDLTRARTKSTFAPADFEPDESHRVRCQELKMPIDDEVRAFKAHEFNRPYSDWRRRFSKWIEESRVKRESAYRMPIVGTGRPSGEAFTVRDDYGRALTLEPSERHRRFASKHGLDLGEVMGQIRDRRCVETLGLERAREIIGELLSKAARARAP